MYPNNIYIKNYATIKKCRRRYWRAGSTSSNNAHGLKHNALARAQYKHWRSIQTGVPANVEREDSVCWVFDHAGGSDFPAAALSLVGTLVGNAPFGIALSSNPTNYRIEQLEKKVEKRK